MQCQGPMALIQHAVALEFKTICSWTRQLKRLTPKPGTPLSLFFLKLASNGFQTVVLDIVHTIVVWDSIAICTLETTGLIIMRTVL